MAMGTGTGIGTGCSNENGNEMRWGCDGMKMALGRE
jgi:hypothetical protein